MFSAESDVVVVTYTTRTHTPTWHPLQTRLAPAARRRIDRRPGPSGNGPDQRQEVRRRQQEFAHTQSRVHHPEPCRHRVLRGHGHRHRSHGPGECVRTSALRSNSY